MVDRIFARRIASRFGCFHGKEMRLALVIAAITALLALAALLFGVQVLRSTLDTIQNEESINVRLLLAMTKSVWVHALMLAGVLISTGFLYTRTPPGLILSFLILLSVDAFLFLWIGPLDTSASISPPTEGANLITVPLFVSLVIRTIGEFSLIVVSIRATGRARTEEEKSR